jgi:streptogramin lyase
LRTLSSLRSRASRAGAPALVAVCLLAAAAPARAVLITEYPLPIANSDPEYIVAGPDGNLWFTEYLSRVGRISTSGQIVDYSTGSGIAANSKPRGIALGSDGNLWFTEQAGNQVERLTTSPPHARDNSPGITANSSPTGIAAGPDGDIWFTEVTANKIGRIYPAGVTGVITEFAVGSQPTWITSGPDGNLWYTLQVDRVGRMTPSGSSTEFFQGITTGGKPNGIVAGPDGNLWFAETAGNRIGRITTNGLVTEFSNGLSANARPYADAVGADGNLWFTELSGRIARVTTTGVITEFSNGLGAGAEPLDIVSGPDQNLWFTDSTGNAIGRLVLDPAATTEGASAVGTVAATVSGIVDPYGADTSYAFQYGTTTSYGSATASQIRRSGSGPAAVASDLTGLRRGTLYHYRVVATSAAGTSFGADGTFTTTTSGVSGGSGTAGGGGGGGSSDHTGPAMKVLTRLLKLGRASKVKLELGCPLTEALGCRGTVTLETAAKHQIRLGKTGFRIGGGQTRTLTIRLTHRGSSVVHASPSLPVRLVVSATDSSHNKRTTVKELKLRR